MTDIKIYFRKFALIKSMTDEKVFTPNHVLRSGCMRRSR